MELYSEGKCQDLDDVVYTLSRMDPNEWTGDFVVQCYGKAGELMILSAFFPEIRKIIPKAKIHLKSIITYKSAVEAAPYKWDNVTYMQNSDTGTEFTSWVNQHCHGGYQWYDNALTVSAFRAHWWFPNDGLQVNSWFIDSFASAIGVKPNIQRCWPSDGDFALALPTLNTHACRRRRLPFSSRQWRDLGRLLLRRGLKLCATGNPADGIPNMPGWEWIDCPMDDVFDILKKARYVIGGQSGLPMSAAIFGRGVTIILDDSLTKLHWEDRKRYNDTCYPSNDYIYDPRGMAEWDDDRCLYFQLDSYTDKMDDLAFEVAKRSVKLIPLAGL